MTTKTKDAKSRVKVGKLGINKETVKNLTSSEARNIKGGEDIGTKTKTKPPTCPAIGRSKTGL